MARRRTPAGEGDRCVRQCACRADGQRTAGNSATVASTVTTKPDGTVRSVSPARRRVPVQSPPASTEQPEPERDVYRRCQDGEDRGLVVIKDGSEADGSTANTLRAGSPMRSVMRLPGRRSACWRKRRNGRFDGHHRAGRHGGDQITSQTAGISTVTATINNSTLVRT